MKRINIKKCPDIPQITELLEAAERLIALPLCINDDLDRLKLPQKMRIHSNAFCMTVKKTNHPHCVAFCRRHVDSLIQNKTGGMIIKCPFGGVQVAGPIFVNGVFTGTLFAGPHCWANDGKTSPLDKARLRDIRNIIASLARDISAMASLKTINHGEEARHNRIIDYITSNLPSGVSLEGLANKLHLSVSRTSHCVKEITGHDFTQLVCSIRKARAVRLLLGGNMQMAAIANELGFCDQSHFTKFFKSQFGVTPSRYRKRNRGE